MKRLQGLGKKCQVKGFIPPLQLQNIAEERTQGIVDFYLLSRQSKSVERQIEDLKIFARSCYLQGLNDAIYSAAQVAHQLK